MLIGSDGRVRLSDFATCWFSDATTPCKHAFVGSAQYMAPETIAGARQPSPQVDVYGLGCIAFFLAFGQHAFLRDTDYLTMNAALREPVVFPFALDDANYVALIERALVKDPQERATMTEMLRVCAQNEPR